MAKQPTTVSSARSVVRMLVVMLIALWTAGTAVLDLSVLWSPPRDDGLAYNRQGVILSVRADSPAAAAGIRAGDRIATADARWFAVRPRPAVESVRVIHNGKTRTVTLRTEPAPLTVGEKVDVGVNALAFFVFLTVGSVLVLIRPSRMTWAFYVFCASTILVHLGVRFPGSLAIYWGLRISIQYLHALGDGAMLVFAARFPDDAPVGWRKWAERAGLAVCLLFPPLQIISWQVRWLAGEFTPQALDHVIALVYAATYIAAIATFFTVYAQSRGQERQRIKWALIFPVVLTLRMPQNLNWITPLPFLVLPYELDYAFFIASMLIPLGVAYAVVRHRAFDITFAISRTIVYGALTSIFVAVFSLLHWFLAKQLAETQLALTASIVAALSLGFWLNSIHRNVDRLVDSIFFRQRHEAERRLARSVAAVPLAESNEAVGHFLINEPVAALDLASAAVFHREGDGRFVRSDAAVGWEACRISGLSSSDPLVLHLVAERSAIRVTEIAWSPPGLPSGAAAPSLAVPVLVRRQLTEIILYGAHRNGADIDPDEERHLVPLAVGAGAAYEHLETEALRTKIDALTREIDLKAHEIEQLRTVLSVQRRQKHVPKTTS